MLLKSFCFTLAALLTKTSFSARNSLRLTTLYWVLLEGFTDFSCYVCVTFDLGNLSKE